MKIRQKIGTWTCRNPGEKKGPVIGVYKQGARDFNRKGKITDSRGQHYSAPWSHVSRSDAQADAERVVKKYRINPPRRMPPLKRPDSKIIFQTLKTHGVIPMNLLPPFYYRGLEELQEKGIVVTHKGNIYFKGEEPQDNPRRHVPKFRPPYTVDVWEERDRLSVVVSDADDKTVAEWWDDDAREMFEDGFFQHGRNLEHSVLTYLQGVGVIGSAYPDNPRRGGVFLVVDSRLHEYKGRHLPPGRYRFRTVQYKPALSLGTDVPEEAIIARLPSFEEAVELAETLEEKYRRNPDNIGEESGQSGGVHVDIYSVNPPPRHIPQAVLTWLHKQPPGSVMSPRTFDDIVQEGLHRYGSLERAREAAGRAYWNAVLSKFKRVHGMVGKLQTRRNPPLPISAMSELAVARSMVREVIEGRRPARDLQKAIDLMEPAIQRLMASHRDHLDFENPPATEIYRNIHEIRAEKADGRMYKHPFKRGSSIWGLSDGSILIKSRSGKRLWKNFPQGEK